MAFPRLHGLQGARQHRGPGGTARRMTGNCPWQALRKPGGSAFTRNLPSTVQVMQSPRGGRHTGRRFSLDAASSVGPMGTASSTQMAEQKPFPQTHKHAPATKLQQTNNVTATKGRGFTRVMPPEPHQITTALLHLKFNFIRKQMSRFFWTKLTTYS